MVLCCHRSNPDKIATLVVNTTISSLEKPAEYLELGYIVSVSHRDADNGLSISVGACLHEAL